MAGTHYTETSYFGASSFTRKLNILKCL